MGIFVRPMLNSFDPRIAASLVKVPSQTVSDMVVLYRDYFIGDQPNPLNQAQQDLLSGGFDPILNICGVIVTEAANRLKVRQIEVQPSQELDGEQQQTTIEHDGETTTDMLNIELRKIWDFNQMDERSGDLHTATGRDGNGFLIVDYDNEKQRVRYTINDAWDGTTGTYGVYGADPHQPKYFVKEWRETVDETTPDSRRVTRRTVYYRNRVEKWMLDPRRQRRGSGFAPLDPENIQEVTNDDGVTYSATVEWWTDTGTPDGTPLGFAVQHFRANGNNDASGTSDLNPVVPGVQDNINLANAMLSAAEQLQSTPISVIFSDADLPTGDDGDSQLEWFPGGVSHVPDTNGSVEQMEPANLTMLNASLDAKIRRAATLTSVPTHVFNLTGQVSSATTQKQNETRLLAKVERRQIAFGNRYEGMAKTALKLLIAFDNDFDLLSDVSQVDDMIVQTTWESAEMQDDLAELEEAEKKAGLGIPQEIIWSELGYTPDQITTMREINAQSAQAAAGQVALAALGVSANGTPDDTTS